MKIETDHLQLIPLGPWHYLALIDSVDQFNKSFGIPAAEGLRDFIDSGEVSTAWIEQLKVASEADPWTHGFAAVHRFDHHVVGTVCFKGPPNQEGMVEIAYGFVPIYQNRGLATEAARALVQFASTDHRVRLIRAHTKDQDNASARVLTKCGFTVIGEVLDPDDGLVWRWERQPQHS